MHGDLAARNILLGGMDGPNSNLVAKVSDFGLSKTLYKDCYKKEKRPYVPWKWMALEFLQDGVFTLTSDSWSFGVVVWEILSFGQEPYMGKEVETTVQEIKNGYRLPCPQSLLSWGQEFYQEITTQCWTTDPQKRANFTKLVEILDNHLSREELEEHKNLETQYGTMQTLMSDSETRSKRNSALPSRENLNNHDKGYHKLFTDDNTSITISNITIDPPPVANGYITVNQAMA